MAVSLARAKLSACALVRFCTFLFQTRAKTTRPNTIRTTAKIVLLSLVINSMYVIQINVRIIGFLLSNTFGTALRISQSFFKGSEFSRTGKTQDSLKNDQYQISCDKKSSAVHVSVYCILFNRK